MKKNEVFICIDMQNDFVTGSLANKEAEKIIPTIVDFIKKFDGNIVFTRDTHGTNYLETVEGEHLPVEHCIINTYGHQICQQLLGYKDYETINKPTFGSVELVHYLMNLFGLYESDEYKNCEIHFAGTCTDICVVSNVLMVKAFFPEAKIYVHKNMCAGLDNEGHEAALLVMQRCHCEIVE